MFSWSTAARTHGLPFIEFDNIERRCIEQLNSIMTIQSNIQIDRLEEILSMMHAFGDCAEPMPESARLIESIVHEQLDALIEKADEIAQLRESDEIGPEDVLFLLRKDKAKLARLINHLYVKDIKQTFNNVNSNDLRILDGAKPQTRRVKICYEFLCKLDEFGEYKKVFNQALFDEIKNQRLRRVDSMTRNMNSQQYNNFTKARQVSFISKIKPEKFSEWLLVHRPGTKLNVFAFEYVQYLAHEIVAQIVDLSLLVRQDAERDPNDPLSVLITKSCHNKHEKAVNFNQTQPNTQSKSHNLPFTDAKPVVQPTPITPNNIHEAMRRYCAQSGPFKEYKIKDKSSPLVILCIS